ncbi:MAG: lytic murein transglycosylase B [Lautropia sp. SCN 70-15]|nr:MAG: lytic murein transglycosylase B [Lautropia sp. SCN 70-15]
MRKTVQTLRFLLAGAGLALAAGCATTPEAVARDYPARPEVRAFIDGLAERHAFDRAALDEIFARVRRSDAAIRLMTPAPPSFKRSWKVYRSRFIDDTRISAGVRFWREHEDTVARASERYGVPEEIIVAIIGVETVFGRITGDHRVIDVLTTLAFDYPRRADYFRSELEQYLLLTRTEGVDPFAVRGSYAGAIGLPQFMPGSIRRWAVDFDGDGRIDLRESPADAIGSVANFLAEHGWAPGEPARYAARIADPERLSPLIEAGITPAFTIDSLRNYGVSSRDPVAFDTKLALIDLPNGDDAPDYWLGARNFYVITRYNRSSFYASAVIELAEALRGEIGR